MAFAKRCQSKKKQEPGDVISLCTIFLLADVDVTGVNIINPQVPVGLGGLHALVIMYCYVLCFIIV